MGRREVWAQPPAAGSAPLGAGVSVTVRWPPAIGQVQRGSLGIRCFVAAEQQPHQVQSVLACLRRALVAGVTAAGERCVDRVGDVDDDEPGDRRDAEPEPLPFVVLVMTPA